MTKLENAVVRAAMALRDRGGWIFRYHRDDANHHSIDEMKMRRLENALTQLACARLAKKGKK